MSEKKEEIRVKRENVETEAGSENAGRKRRRREPRAAAPAPVLLVEPRLHLGLSSLLPIASLISHKGHETRLS
jgi:hypothetical protein